MTNNYDISECKKWILMEDESILVINKPGGLLTIQDGYNPSLQNLVQLLNAMYGKVWVIHRLDKDTSGAIVLAKNPEAHRTLSMQFKDRKIHKEYRAIVRGCPEWDNHTCTAPLKVNGDRNHRTIVNLSIGKPAVTEFVVQEKYNQYAYLNARPITGYTHQIRSHLAWLGFPIVNDRLYQPKNSGERADEIMFPSERLCLHAAVLTFFHPVDNHVMTIEASLPESFLLNLQELRNHSG